MKNGGFKIGDFVNILSINPAIPAKYTAMKWEITGFRGLQNARLADLLVRDPNSIDSMNTSVPVDQITLYTEPEAPASGVQIIKASVGDHVVAPLKGQLVDYDEDKGVWSLRTDGTDHMPWEFALHWAQPFTVIKKSEVTDMNKKAKKANPNVGFEIGDEVVVKRRETSGVPKSYEGEQTDEEIRLKAIMGILRWSDEQISEFITLLAEEVKRRDDTRYKLEVAELLDRYSKLPSEHRDSFCRALSDL